MEKLVSIFKKVVLFDIFVAITIFTSYFCYECFTYGSDTYPMYDITVQILVVTLILTFVLTVLQIYIYYLLLNIKPLAKKLYIPFTVAVIVFSLLMPQDTMTYPYFFTVLEWFGGVGTGAIVTLMYCTDLKYKFDS